MGLKLNLNVAQPSNNKDSYDMKQFERQIVPIDELLCWCSETQASDLYIKEYEAPYISRFGQVVRLPCRPTSRDVWRAFYGKYVQEELNAKYRRNKMLDVSVQIRIPEDSKFYGKTESNFFRYRASLGFSENHDIATFRMINPEPPTFDTINYPTQCKEALEKAFSSRLGINIFSGPTGSGKALHKETLIPTPNGLVRMEEIKIGDTVFSKDGSQTKVINKYNPNSSHFYEFTFSDGTKVKSAEDHLWEVELLNENTTTVLSTKDIVDIGLQSESGRLNFAIERPKAAKFKKEDLPIDTYTLGMLLSDNKIPSKYSPDILNLYKTASIDDKLKLIAGIVDKNGKINKSGYCFINLVDKNNIYAIREICCSLGFECSNIKTENNLFILSFYPSIDLTLKDKHKKEKLKNKKEEKAQRIKREKFYLKNIKEIKGKNEDYYCIAVNHPSHLFLCTESYIPTHNTTSQAAVLNTFTREGGLLDNRVIISLEDPIEYEFKSTNSVKFSQKELDKDFITFASGIKQSLRENPGFLLIGECRDKEVITAVCEASRTGHVVSTSFHAGTVGGTVSRLLFHLDNNKDLTYDLILNLNIIMAQTLIKQESSYLVDTQYLLFNDSIKKRILAAFNNNENIQMTVDSLVHNKELQEQKLSKDWSYYDLQTL